MEVSKELVKDGWEPVVQCGKIYWNFYDCGEKVTTVTRECRDKILQNSKLPLKLIENGEELCILSYKDCVKS